MLHPDIERLAALGWRLYPASDRSKAGCFSGATDAATCDRDQLMRWSRVYPRCNWRVVMLGSGIWALDCDVPPGHAHNGIANLAELAAAFGPIPRRPQLRTGGGGLALFFRDTGAPIIGAPGNPAPGIDPRRGRQSQTIPPSRHWRMGQPYRWLVAPWEIAPPPAPAWLLRLLVPAPAPPPLPREIAHLSNAPERVRRYALAALRHAGDRVATAPPGSRNDTLNRETYALTKFIAEGALDSTEISTAMAYAGRQAGLLPREVQSTLASALAAGMPR